MVVLPETETLSRASLYAAFQRRSTYATTGPMMPIQVAFESLGFELGRMGEDLSLPEGQRCGR